MPSVDFDLEAKVRYLADRAEIADVMGRYCLGMDLRDWDMYRSCWAEKVNFDVGDFQFDECPFDNLSVDDWIAGLRAFFDGLESSQHVKYPVSFDFDGDRATVYAIMQGKHWMSVSGGEPLQTVVGYYHEVYIRTAAGWKMSSSKERLHWNEGNFDIIERNMTNMFAALRGRTDDR